MPRLRFTWLAVGSLSAALAGLAASLPATAASAPASPSLTQAHDFSLSASVACQTGYEFPQFFSTPAVGDLFGDGRKEIIAAFPDGSVHAWYSDTFAEVSGWPQYTGDNVAASPTLAALDGDTHPSVIVSSYEGVVHVWNGSGQERAGWPQSNKFADPVHGTPRGFFSSVAVGDAFGDGSKELFATGLDQHTYAWFSNGAALPGWPKLTSDTGLATPALADLQHNGTLSIVTPSDASGRYGVWGGLYYAWGADGSQLWVRGVDEVPWASPAITDFGDGNLATINGTGHYYHQTRNAANGRYLVGFNQDGQNRPGFPVGANDVSFASPAVGDLYGNGGRQIVEVTEGGTLYALAANGSAVPGFPVALPGGHNFPAAPSIAPVDGTGRNGIYAPTAGGVAVYSMANLGSPSVVTTPGMPFSAPTVADLGAGHLSLVQASVVAPGGTQNCGQAYGYHVTVFDVNGTNPTLGPSSWPTFHGNMQRTGSNTARSPLRVPMPPFAAHATAPLLYQNSLNVFAKGADGTLDNYWFAGRWYEQSLGGSLGGNPAAVVYGNSVNVFARGADGTLYDYWLAGGHWYARNLGGRLAGDPAAVTYLNSINVFARGADGTLYNYWNAGGAWYAQSLGGSLAGDPSATPYLNSINVFATGTDRTLDNYWNVGGTWYGQSLGGALASDPAVVLYNNSVNVFARGADMTLDNFWSGSGGWQSQSLGGRLSGDPSVILYSNSVNVFATGANATLDNYWSTGGAWYEQSLGGRLAGDPGAIVYGNSVNVFAKGGDGTLSNYWNDGSWYLQSLGGRL